MSQIREGATQNKVRNRSYDGASVEHPLQISISAQINNRTIQRSINLSQLDSAFIAELRDQLPAQTAQCIQDTFGISANTWLKLCRGMPIRRSVAKRLLHRFGVTG